MKIQYIDYRFYLVYEDTNSFADKKFEKDLKKISKGNAFIDNSGKIYSVDKINKKENTILIIYTHGGDG